MLINRMIAFKEFYPGLKVDIMFFHDSGGLLPLQRALDAHGVNARVFVASEFEESKKYDVVFCIDCPQAFGLCERHGFSYVIECHSAYLESRGYLKKLPKTCEKFMLVPSAEFAAQIKAEVPGMDVLPLRNFIPGDDAAVSGNPGKNPGWVKQPLLFFSRMDSLKNPLLLLDALFELEKENPGKFFAVMCGEQRPEIDMQKEISRRKLQSAVMILPSVDFMRSVDLMRIIKDSQGVFISPSQGESFGLSAAEAISIGMPVLLSDIPAHRFLVSGCNDLIFSLGAPGELAEKVKWVARHYDGISAKMEEIRGKFSLQNFIDDWVFVVDRLRGIGSEAGADDS